MPDYRKRKQTKINSFFTFYRSEYISVSPVIYAQYTILTEEMYKLLQWERLCT